MNLLRWSLRRRALREQALKDYDAKRMEILKGVEDAGRGWKMELGKRRPALREAKAEYQRELRCIANGLRDE